MNNPPLENQKCNVLKAEDILTLASCENETITINNNFHICKRSFITCRGLLQHVKYCKIKNDKAMDKLPLQNATIMLEDEIPIPFQNQTANFKWGAKEGAIFANELNSIYNEIVMLEKEFIPLTHSICWQKIYP